MVKTKKSSIPNLNPISRLSSIHKLIMHQDTNCVWSTTFWYLVWCFLQFYDLLVCKSSCKKNPNSGQ
jgi:hypothetical protein